MEADQKRLEFLNIKVIDGTANENTWEKLSKIEKRFGFYRKGSMICRKFKRSVYLI